MSEKEASPRKRLEDKAKRKIQLCLDSDCFFNAALHCISPSYSKCKAKVTE